MTTGEKIAAERKKLNLTQQEFADRLGVTRQAVSRWESDLAFPETDKLVKMSELFGCSTDYLLKYNGNNGGSANDGAENAAQGADENAEKTAENTAENTPRNESENAQNANGWGNFGGFTFDPKKFYFEYKSKTTVFGLPLLHVNIGLGRVAKGFFSIGLVSVGVFAIGLVSLGAVALGVLALGLLALGSLAVGIISAGAIAVGIIALGGVAIGCFSLGGCSIGLFACGGYANGHYVAIGDYATGQIAFGKTTAIGSQLAVKQETYDVLKERAVKLMEGIPPFWQGFVNWSKGLMESFPNMN